MLSAGNWVLMKGIDKFITKNATLWDPEFLPDEVETFRPIDIGVQPVIRVACEPLNPSELPNMLEGLTKAVKGYQACEVKVEESGEHILVGTGELFMDSLLRDIR